MRVSAEEVLGGPPRLVGEAYVTMVAVDASGHPVPVPPLALGTPEERTRFEEGRQRMEARKRSRRRP